MGHSVSHTRRNGKNPVASFVIYRLQNCTCTTLRFLQTVIHNEQWWLCAASGRNDGRNGCLSSSVPNVTLLYASFSCMQLPRVAPVLARTVSLCALWAAAANSVHWQHAKIPESVAGEESEDAVRVWLPLASAAGARCCTSAS